MADGFGFDDKSKSLYPHVPPPVNSHLSNYPPPYPPSSYPPNMPLPPNTSSNNFYPNYGPSAPPSDIYPPSYPPRPPGTVYPPTSQQHYPLNPHEHYPSRPHEHYPSRPQEHYSPIPQICPPRPQICPPRHQICPPTSNYPPVIPYPSYPTQPNVPHGLNRAYYWVETTAGRGVPPTAVQGGVDQDGTTIYVGRAFHEGDWIPAKVIPEKNVAYVAYGGGEHAKSQFQVLCEQRFDWVQCHGTNIPPNAVQGGNTSDGEPLYVGRVWHEGSHTVGKIHPSHGTCYIPFDGNEVGYADYEVLVLRG